MDQKTQGLPYALQLTAEMFDGAGAAGSLYVVIRCDTDVSAIERSSLDELTRKYVEWVDTSSHPDRFRLLWKSILGAASSCMAWRPPEARGAEVSLSPSNEPFTRRCVRVLAMVHELHKAGYQRIRVLPMLSPSGCHWRAIITHAGNVCRDGFTLIDDDIDDALGKVARYTSAQESEYFGWKDAAGLDARNMANLFIKRFPAIAAAGAGLDWAYAGWLTDVLGQAERHGSNGGLIHLIQDWPSEPDYMRRWQPPPPP